MNDKPILMQVSDPAEIAALRAGYGRLDTPCIVNFNTPNDPRYFADADELRQWRAAQSQSAAEQK